jgi:hypothetical protein
LGRVYTFDRLTALKGGMKDWHALQGKIRTVKSVLPHPPPSTALWFVRITRWCKPQIVAFPSRSFRT